MTLAKLVQHINKSWVGLDKVANIGPATDEQVTAKELTDSLLSLKQALSTFTTTEQVTAIVNTAIQNSGGTGTVAQPKVSMAKMSYLFGR